VCSAAEEAFFVEDGAMLLAFAAFVAAIQGKLDD